MNPHEFRASLFLRILISSLIVAPALGWTAVMDFNSIPTPSFENPVSNPWIEDGMTLSCTQPSNGSPTPMVIRTASNRNTGTKSVSATYNHARFSLTRSSGGSFSMKSIRLFPFSSGFNGTVTFQSYSGGNLQNTVTFATGSSLAGALHTFTGFENIEELRWFVNNNQTGASYHQFDDLTVELPSLITVPADITVSEGSGPFGLVVRREAGTSALAVGCTWATNGASVADFTLGIGNPHTFNFTGTGSEETVGFSVTAADDSLNEPAETLVITWNTSPSYELSSPTTTITLGDTDGSGFDDYMAGHGLTGNDALPDADPNADGISNIEAYVFRLNPAGPFPASWLTRLPRFTTHSGGRSTFPAITWQLPQPWPSDVGFTVTESSTLDSWATVATRNGYGIGSLWTGPGAGTVTDGGTPLRTVTVAGTSPMHLDPDGHFLRLGLTKLSGGFD